MKHTRRTVKTSRRRNSDLTPEALRMIAGLVTVARINARSFARS